jgi:hypothetical protein
MGIYACGNDQVEWALAPAVIRLAMTNLLDIDG